MAIQVGAGWQIGQGWNFQGGPAPGTEIVTLSELTLTTISGLVFVTI
jgi:hypothetical protein